MLMLLILGDVLGRYCTHDSYAYLIKYVDGYGDEQEGENVGCGGHYGTDNKDDDECMAAIAPEERGIDESQAGEKPAKDGKLEHQSHEEGEHHEGGHVGVYRDEVGDRAAHLIGAQETYGQGEDEQVAYRTAHDVEQVAPCHYWDGIAPFMLV